MRDTYPPTWPESTYRLQFHSGFTFRDATAIVPYLRDLGITHCYASPYLKARPGSTHGYDVIDHCKLNPEIGTEADFEAWVRAMADHDLSHVLDIVPNHVGVATNENLWWNDVLENGPASRFAAYFDIAWKASGRPELWGKLLLPLLGELYSKVLEAGKLRLAFEDGAFALRYFDRRFPISLQTYSLILGQRAGELEKVLETADLEEYRAIIAAADSASGRDSGPIKARLRSLADRTPSVATFIQQNVERLNGIAGKPESFEPLDELIGRQNYRLAYWRVAPDEINYRRFFDVNDLAALSMERPEVFRATHELILRLIREKKLQGLRIDHPDGLYDPKQYLERLQQASGKNEPLYVVVEKILAVGEPLPVDWPVAGTSGYDFLNSVNGLFVQIENDAAFSELYEEQVATRTQFADLIYEKKLLILNISLASELHTLAKELDRLAQKDRRSRDFTFRGLHDALARIIACFPVYRTYISAEGIHESDRRWIERAIAAAVARNPAAEPDVFYFIRDLLLQKHPASFDEFDRAAQLHFACKFQQLTSPVTAKGIEDTAFYIYNRLTSLNEVGGDPGKFGNRPDEVHRYLTDRQSKWPYAMSCLSTHDAKRGEDVRARISVLSERPDDWRQCIKRWSRANARHRKTVGTTPAPDANDEYLLYQTLTGAWPLDGTDDPSGPDFIGRIQAYMQKAMRESKVRTGWTSPDEPYETAVKSFISLILDRDTGREFLADFVPFQKSVSECGLFNSLSQTLLRLTAPGVPDTYQGTELWDFSLVDPDNRRPVDYGRRQNLLDELKPLLAPGSNLLSTASALLESKEDGRVKLFVTHVGLAQRRQAPGLFSRGEYLRGQPGGSRADHVFGFARRLGRSAAVVVAPRFFTRLIGNGRTLPVGEDLWGDTTFRVPGLTSEKPFRNVFTGESLMPRHSQGGLEFRPAEALAHFPVGLFVSD